MISPISFAGTTPSAPTFADLLKKPQAYTSTPVAASKIVKSSKTKKGSLGKKILTAVGVTAAIAAALAAGNKFGLAEHAYNGISKIKNEKIQVVLATITSALNWAGEKIYSAGSKLFGLVSRKAPEVADDTVEIAKETAQTVIG